jgi:hypothetical protein
VEKWKKWKSKFEVRLKPLAYVCGMLSRASQYREMQHVFTPAAAQPQASSAPRE